MMNAVFTPTYGTASTLQLRHIPIPTPGPGEVLVQVEASAVTAGDRRIRSADFGPGMSLMGRLFIGLFGPRRPVQGTMFAGVVTAVGQGVERFQVGDAVFGSVAAGAWAEYLVVHADGPIAQRPAGVTPAEAAATPYGAGTAWHFLHDLAAVKPGERVLVLGGAGGVGRFAIQIARHLGAHVTAVGRRTSFDMMRELGAHEVLDHQAGDFAARGETWDVVFDTADVSSLGHSRPALRPTGRFMTLYGGLRVLVDMLRTRRGRGPRALFAVVTGNRARTETLAKLLAEGAIRPVVAATFALDDVAAAHRCAEQRAPGDVVVLPTPRGGAAASIAAAA